MIYIVIAIIIIFIILQYKNTGRILRGFRPMTNKVLVPGKAMDNYEPFFSGKYSYFNPFNKYRDPYSIFMWRDMYNKHNRWQDIHRKYYVPLNELTLS